MRGPGANGDSPEPRPAAEGDSEAARLEAAYRLAATGGPAVSELIAAMREQTLAALEETTAKTPDNAHGTNPTPGPAATALTAAGAAALPALIDTLEDSHWWVRAVAAGALARMGAEAAEAVPALTAALGDDHWWVRRNAAEALGTAGVYCGGLVGEMGRLLGDGDYRDYGHWRVTRCFSFIWKIVYIPIYLPLSLRKGFCSGVGSGRFGGFLYVSRAGFFDPPFD